MVAILGVLVIGFFLLLAFVIDAGSHVVTHYANQLDAQTKAEQKVENQTGITTLALGFDSKHPPQLDVWKPAPTCSVNQTGQAQAVGKVTNHSGHASSYVITVDFTAGGNDLGGGVASVFHVDPGQAVSYTVVGGSTSDKSVSCKVTSVYRSDNPNVLPVTTTTG